MPRLIIATIYYQDGYRLWVIEPIDTHAISSVRHILARYTTEAFGDHAAQRNTRAFASPRILIFHMSIGPQAYRKLYLLLSKASNAISLAPRRRRRPLCRRFLD